ncbi:MAG TPA: phosphotransferase [Nocardioidaceae bacterium]|nr:phosphotransferase [Nocardioidaceae bacterium]
MFVDGDSITGVVDWSEAGQGDVLYDLANYPLRVRAVIHASAKVATLAYLSAGDGWQACWMTWASLGEPQKSSACSVSRVPKCQTSRPSVNTVVRSSMSAPTSNSSGAMKREAPNIRPMSFMVGPRR